MRLALHKGKWLGILVVILSFIYIAYRLLQYRQQFSITDIPQGLPDKLVVVITLQVILLCVNIFFETKKWQFLLCQIKSVGFGHALKMVMAGFASGIFTPAKLGEPVGRMLFLNKAYWAKATVMNYMGGVVHNIVIFSAALPCLLLGYKILAINLSLVLQFYMLCLIVVSAMLLLFWYQREWLKKIALTFHLAEQVKGLLWQMRDTPKKVMGMVGLYSLLRFVVYCIQLCVFLWFLGADIKSHLLIVVPVYFMLITMAPSLFLAELGIRGSVALFVFTGFGLTEVAVLFVVLVLWLLNQVLPALVGTVVLLYNRTGKILH